MNTTQQTTRPTNPWFFAIQIGFFAGLIWGTLKAGEYFLKFSKVPLAFFLKPALKPSVVNTAYGFWLGLMSFIVFSIIASLLYTALFRQSKGFWLGLIYGVGWWMLLYILIGPALKMIPPLRRLDWNSIITDFCLFLLWGMFIGYSIALEFTDERMRETPTSGSR